MAGLDWVDVENAGLKSQGLWRSLRQAETASEPEMTLDGRRIVQFASNNYLGLSTHPKVIAAAQAAASKFGTGAGASRLINGSQSIHAELEAELARRKGAEAALVFATGSMANLGVLQALAGPGDLIVLDKLDHATLYDGARLSGAEIRRFVHGDLAQLEAQLAGWPGKGRRFVAVDAVFSMEGDIAQLPGLLALCGRLDAVLIVDEAHSTGVLGARGRGILEHFGIGAWPAGLVLTGTLSKSLASLGGFAAGPQTLIDFLINKSRSFIFATGLPAACAAAALEALRVLEVEPRWLAGLWRRRELLADGLAKAGWDFRPSRTPIFPLAVGRAADALALQDRLWEAGYFAPAIRPPTVPANACRLRLSVMATHSEAQIEGFLDALGSRP